MGNSEVFVVTSDPHSLEEALGDKRLRKREFFIVRRWPWWRGTVQLARSSCVLLWSRARTQGVITGDIERQMVQGRQQRIQSPCWPSHKKTSVGRQTDTQTHRGLYLRVNKSVCMFISVCMWILDALLCEGSWAAARWGWRDECISVCVRLQRYSGFYGMC